MSSFRCTACSRSYSRDLGDMREMVLLGRTTCQFCGGALEFPPEAHEVEAAQGELELPFPPRKQVNYSCEGCGKTFRHELLRLVELLLGASAWCRFCQGKLLLPPEVHAGAEALWAQGYGVDFTTCLLCARDVDFPNQADEARCDTCGATFRPPLERGGAPRPPQGKGVAAPASRAERGPPAFREILRARADAGELKVGEATRLQEVAAGLAGWRPDPDDSFLPLPLEFAERVLPGLLFSGIPYTVDRGQNNRTELVFVVSTQSGSRLANGTGKTLLFNLVGTLSLATVGLGVFSTNYDDTGEAPPQTQQRLRLRLQSKPGGVQLFLLAQRNAERPTEAPEASAQLRTALFEQRPALEAYLAALALFGPCAAGEAAFSITRKAAANRLDALGVGGRPEEFCPSARRIQA